MCSRYFSQIGELSAEYSRLLTIQNESSTVQPAPTGLARAAAGRLLEFAGQLLHAPGGLVPESIFLWAEVAVDSLFGPDQATSRMPTVLSWVDFDEWLKSDTLGHHQALHEASLASASRDPGLLAERAVAMLHAEQQARQLAELHCGATIAQTEGKHAETVSELEYRLCQAEAVSEVKIEQATGQYDMATGSMTEAAGERPSVAGVAGAGAGELGPQSDAASEAQLMAVASEHEAARLRELADLVSKHSSAMQAVRGEHAQTLKTLAEERSQLESKLSRLEEQSNLELQQAEAKHEAAMQTQFVREAEISATMAAAGLRGSGFVPDDVSSTSGESTDGVCPSDASEMGSRAATPERRTRSKDNVSAQQPAPEAEGGTPLRPASDWLDELDEVCADLHSETVRSCV